MNDDKLINLMNDIDESYIDEAMPKRFRHRFRIICYASFDVFA